MENKQKKRMKTFYMFEEIMLAIRAVKRDRNNSSLGRVIEDLFSANKKIRKGTFDYVNDFLDRYYVRRNGEIMMAKNEERKKAREESEVKWNVEQDRLGAERQAEQKAYRDKIEGK